MAYAWRGIHTQPINLVKELRWFSLQFQGETLGTRYCLISIRLRRSLQFGFLCLCSVFPQRGHLVMVRLTKRFVLHLWQKVFLSLRRLFFFNCFPKGELIELSFYSQSLPFLINLNWMHFCIQHVIPAGYWISLSPKHLIGYTLVYRGNSGHLPYQPNQDCRIKSGGPRLRP